MIFLVDIHRINFINVEIEDDTIAFVVSCNQENDVDDLYKYFSGFRMGTNSTDAYWHHKTGLETILETENFYSNRYSYHWKYFVFDIPDEHLDEETELYLRLKYC